MLRGRSVPPASFVIDGLDEVRLFDAFLGAKQLHPTFRNALVVYIYILRRACSVPAEKFSSTMQPHTWPLRVVEAVGDPVVRDTLMARVLDDQDRNQRFLESNPPKKGRNQLGPVKKARWCPTGEATTTFATAFMDDVLLRLPPPRRSPRGVVMGDGDREALLASHGILRALANGLQTRAPSRKFLEKTVRLWTGRVYGQVQQECQGRADALTKAQAVAVRDAIVKYMESYALRVPNFPAGTNTTHTMTIYRGMRISRAAFVKLRMTKSASTRRFMAFSSNFYTALHFATKQGGVGVMWELSIKNIPVGTPWIHFWSPSIKVRDSSMGLSPLVCKIPRPAGRFGAINSSADENEILLPPGKIVVMGPPVENRVPMLGSFFVVPVRFQPS